MNPRARTGSWEPLLAGGCLLVAAAAVAWYLTAELLPPKPVVPKWSGAPFQALSARLPEIAAWDAFYVNDDNPFVPWREREVEAQRLKEPKPVAIKPRPPAVIKPVEPPKRTLPARAAGGGDAPRVLGFQGRGDAAAAIVRLAGETSSRVMRPGETAGRWTFVGIEAGNIAHFKDADGRGYAIVIGGGK